jgi:hypothetical protein
LATGVLGHLQFVFGAINNPNVYGKTIAAAIFVAQYASLPFMYLAGKEYRKK